MNSRDGIDAATDSIALSAVGGHVHVNWAFSAPGTYRVGLGASGRLAATGQTNASPVVEYTFLVQDVPWRPRLACKCAACDCGDCRSCPRTLVLSGETGRRYAIESTTNFQHWATLTNFIASAPETELPLPDNAGPSQYFRALAPSQ
jgi:surface-anchored protein